MVNVFEHTVKQPSRYLSGAGKEIALKNKCFLAIMTQVLLSKFALDNGD
jgi:hypothetical protein